MLGASRFSLYKNTVLLPCGGHVDNLLPLCYSGHGFFGADEEQAISLSLEFVKGNIQ